MRIFSTAGLLSFKTLMFSLICEAIAVLGFAIFLYGVHQVAPFMVPVLAGLAIMYVAAMLTRPPKENAK